MNSIFITGAGAGIGRATAHYFVAKGWFVGAADLDEAALHSLQEELGEAQCSIHVTDVVDAASVRQSLAGFAARTDGRLDVLHNNAGLLRVGRFEEIHLEDHRQVVDVNLTGLINVLHTAFPYLRDTPGARVVNMSSASAIYGTPDFASYSATKHGVRAMTEALDIEWEGYDIRVCDLMPPFVKTGMVASNEAGSGMFNAMGVHLTAEDVAREVWKLTRSSELHRPITRRMRSLWTVSGTLPAAAIRGIIKRLWGR
ncbi:NADP-dependent 3-hydroxy acid dehydrogenase YdfG [Halospina denitrificans]|uniref:NADP-dependent 3-hydroxy acid dehydrogenase YdfG n=1 Tax=Halospina denitrificans TaxID=332522 RepID=A0A4R7JRF3_9GAMM|nr:SDR family oxidoreductase [Halospina denitrificans]TDT40394.1 NADP-dependent 3-hydroxy acid dehydrogenase YdfG [Halospina denitrificans]